MREYGICHEMLAHLRIRAVRLMTNNPRKVQALRDQNIDVVERIGLQAGQNLHNVKYLATKAGKLGHLFDHQQES
jgi:GTP cyclohydrolase II